MLPSARDLDSLYIENVWTMFKGRNLSDAVLPTASVSGLHLGPGPIRPLQHLGRGPMSRQYWGKQQHLLLPVRLWVVR